MDSKTKTIIKYAVGFIIGGIGGLGTTARLERISKVENDVKKLSQENKELTRRLKART